MKQEIKFLIFYFAHRILGPSAMCGLQGSPLALDLSGSRWSVMRCALRPSTQPKPFACFLFVGTKPKAVRIVGVVNFLIIREQPLQLCDGPNRLAARRPLLFRLPAVCRPPSAAHRFHFSSADAALAVFPPLPACCFGSLPSAFRRPPSAVPPLPAA